jgi:hypothetical protein
MVLKKFNHQGAEGARREENPSFLGAPYWLNIFKPGGWRKTIRLAKQVDGLEPPAHTAV